MPTKNVILVVGGAGFIGSHMVRMLHDAGYCIIVLDNLSKGHRDAVSGAVFIKGDAGDRLLLEQIFKKYDIDTVMHFASLIEVGESVENPNLYYENNVAATLTLLDCMLRANVKRFIFSSTAAVYGEPQYTPINEKHPLQPINPYGRTKLLVEQQLALAAEHEGLQYASLRYFNAAGAQPDGSLTERHEPESHLIPLILKVANGERDAINVYGEDYATPDGTCVRDYVHVVDICQAHLQALSCLQQGQKEIICNLGTGKGYSVKEVIAAVAKVTEKTIRVNLAASRMGDPAILVANADKAKSILNWQPKYQSIDTIVSHAWQAVQKQVEVA